MSLGFHLGNYAKALGLKPREWDLAVHCPRCNYWLKIKSQTRHGAHGCMQCGGGMEVYFPRPARFEQPQLRLP